MMNFLLAAAQFATPPLPPLPKHLAHHIANRHRHEQSALLSPRSRASTLKMNRALAFRPHQSLLQLSQVGNAQFPEQISRFYRSNTVHLALFACADHPAQQARSHSISLEQPPTAHLAVFQCFQRRSHTRSCDQSSEYQHRFATPSTTKDMKRQLTAGCTFHSLKSTSKSCYKQYSMRKIDRQRQTESF